jgi:hypothetical protein
MRNHAAKFFLFTHHSTEKTVATYYLSILECPVRPGASAILFLIKRVFHFLYCLKRNMCRKCVSISERACCGYHFRLLFVKCFKQNTVLLTFWLQNTMYIKGKLSVEDKRQLYIMI